jgi:predicted CopG family antitoxin
MKKQLNITIEEDLYEKVKADAKKESRTISNYIQKVISDHFTAKKP